MDDGDHADWCALQAGRRCRRGVGGRSSDARARTQTQGSDKCFHGGVSFKLHDSIDVRGIPVRVGGKKGEKERNMRS